MRSSITRSVKKVGSVFQELIPTCPVYDPRWVECVLPGENSANRRTAPIYVEVSRVATLHQLISVQGLRQTWQPPHWAML